MYNYKQIDPNPQFIGKWLSNIYDKNTNSVISGKISIYHSYTQGLWHSVFRFYNRGLAKAVSVAKNAIISTETGTKESTIGSNHQAKTVDLELDIFDEKIRFRINVMQARANLADIVPLARTICSKITFVLLKNIHKNGDQIPCRKGCPACCKRCLIPLSVPEAFRLNDEIDQAPTFKWRLIRKNCLIASHHLLTQKTTKDFVHQLSDSTSNKPTDPDHISEWYSSLKLACPFLHRDICTIYEQRPLVCREHFITGSAGGCNGDNCFAEVLHMPIRVSNALGQLASELEGTTIEAVILPLALIWCDENKKRAERTWPFEMMVKHFAEIIEEMAAKNSTAVAV
jgi:Fe-S-cluster containining protein